MLVLGLTMALASCGGAASDIEIARDAVDAWNTGDVDTYLAFYADDAIYIDRPAHGTDVREGFAFWMELGFIMEIDECEQWEDGRTRCHVIARDDLTAPAGFIMDADLSFWVTDGRITKYSSLVYEEPSWYFITEMGWWLEGAHPDVWERTFALPERCSHDEYNCWGSWRGTEETAAALLEHGTEFIEHADQYSLTE